MFNFVVMPLLGVSVKDLLDANKIEYVCLLSKSTTSLKETQY